MEWDELDTQLDSISLERKQELELMAKLLSRVMDRRRELGMTQEELGRRAGLKQAYITRVERGVTIPRIDTLLRMAHALDLEVVAIPRELLKGMDEMVTTASG
ncbi:MAG: helix-turn-helix domain-containing protein [Bacilli bacterium]